jgi:hypothetical protein
MGKFNEHRIIKVLTDSFRNEPFERSMNELVEALNAGWEIVSETHVSTFAIYVIGRDTSVK